MSIITIRYRIKDSTSAKHLNKMAGSVNFVWNYCNEVNFDRWRKFRKTYSGYELNNKTAGCSEELGLNANSIQSICEHFSKVSRQFKKPKLAWRNRKRSLGWIPFKGPCVKIKNSTIIYYKKTFKFWESTPFYGKIKTGSFNQNSKGQWFVNLVIDGVNCSKLKTGKEVGIDLGVKTIATLSDGREFHRKNITNKYALRVAMAQRAKKKKLIKTLFTKIKNSRRDWNHKTTSIIIQEYDLIAVGDVKPLKLVKNKKRASAIYDAGWFSFKTMLAYKAIRLGVVYKEVKERFSTVTCSACNERTGPRGQADLGVRSWVCSNCGESHDRDVNAAKNILNNFRIGHDTPSRETIAV